MEDKRLQEIATTYRSQLFEKFLEVGQGHPGSTFSILDLVVTLYHGGYIRATNGHLEDWCLMSKGHATVAQYPALRDLGIISQEDWNNWGISATCLRVFGNTSIPGIQVTSGSLGHGIGIGCGIARRSIDRGSDSRVYAIISEGELYEGSTWEALLFLSHHNFLNMHVFIDVNNLIILGKTDDCLRLNPIREKISGFDLDVSEIDGHDFGSIRRELDRISTRPKVTILNTIKGRGFKVMENKANWHYWNPLSDEEILDCRKGLLNVSA